MPVIRLSLRRSREAHHAAAEMVDTMRWKEVVGTLAGDNTILVFLRSIEVAPEVAERFKGMMK